MNALVGLLLLAAAVYLVVRIGRGVRALRSGSTGCGSCCSCPTGSKKRRLF
jgi:hypothetical protein